MKKSVLTFVLLALSLWLQAQNYPQVIIPGNYADPSIMRDGEDYYMTHSPLYDKPGFLIWHSRDLVNWEPLCRACPQLDDSVWAPELLKHNGRFYIYYPTDKRDNYVIYADDIRGPWSDPIKLDVKGIDPGHIVGEDGQRYLFLNKGFVVPLSEDGLKVTGKKKKVYDGWEYPKTWVTEGNNMYLESPKLIFKDGYYYMTSAEGGTAGPATSHMCVMARAKNIDGPWENSSYNPLVHTYSARDNWWSKGHGTLIDDVNGNWWMVYHAYAKGYHTLGRQTLIEPMQFTTDGWFRPSSSVVPLPEDKSLQGKWSLNDDFSSDSLGLQWSFWKEYTPQSVALENGALWMNAKGSTPADGNMLMIIPEDKCYDTQVDVQLKGNATAGLVLLYNEQAFVGLASDGKNITVYQPDGQKNTTAHKLGKTFKLKIQNKGNKVKMLASKDGKTWTTLASDVDVSRMHHNNLRGFLSLRVALSATGKGKVGFRRFRYGNVAPQEKDMAGYLMVYHRDETHGLHMAISEDGYTFTALNDNHPVIAGDTIAYQRGIRDPHIFRGPDGAFYLAMTDLHIYAQKAGYRDTEWERSPDYGWGNNRGLVLMKSWDLVNWKRANINLDALSAAYSEIGCAWAPEVTFDEKKGKLMIYFTMRFRSEANKLYYVYVNDDFDTLEGTPQILFEYPDEHVSAIDGDITKVGDKYHLFYVAHDGVPGIKHAVSDRPDGDWAFDPRWYDYEPKNCEAPNVWKRIGQDKWVLMYDVYSIHPHNFAFVETSDFVRFEHLGRFNEGVMKTTNFTSPKHGAVVHLTAEELENLKAYWAANKREFVPTAK